MISLTALVVTIQPVHAATSSASLMTGLRWDQPANFLSHDRYGNQSYNWSGLVDTGSTFTSVVGVWTVPTIKPSQLFEAAGEWVGIGGAVDSGLIQTGTIEATQDGASIYQMFYEMLPAPPVYFADASPGDLVSASVTQVGPTSWRIYITDDTSGAGINQVFSYATPAESAEWVIEPPGNDVGIAPFADFGSITFWDLQVTGPNLGQVAVQPVDSYDLYSGMKMASSTGLITGDQVTVTYVAQGYDIVSAYGDVYSYGYAVGLGAATTPADTTAAMAIDQATGGYWLVTKAGWIAPFDANYYGSMSGVPLRKPIVGMAGDPETGGYWLVASDGGIFAFNAPFLGSMGGVRLNQPIVGMTPTPDGGGYWLVASDGGIFAFGDAGFFGSTGGIRLQQPIVGMATDQATGGYWLVAADGGVFSFNAPFMGSTGNMNLASSIVGMAPTSDDNGYWFVGAGGEVYSFGDATFLGGADSPDGPVVGIVPAA